MSIGFGDQKEENDYTGTTKENYNHVVKLFGIPVYSSTKVHTVDSVTNGRPAV